MRFSEFNSKTIVEGELNLARKRRLEFIKKLENAIWGVERLVDSPSLHDFIKSEGNYPDDFDSAIIKKFQEFKIEADKLIAILKA